MPESTARSGSEPILTVSVIVPVRNEAQQIGACLRSLMQQDFPTNRMEILIVDNASTDGTAQICRNLGFPPLYESRPGAGLARNRGLAAARNELVAFTDADCELPGDWLNRIVMALEDTDAVMGWVDPAPDDSGYALARAALHRDYLSECRKLAVTGRLDRLDTANCGGWRRVFEDAGGFHPEIFPAEDRELGARIAEHGGKIRFDEEIRARHHYEPRLFRSMARARNVGHMWARILELFPHEYVSRHFPDVLSAAERARSPHAASAYRRRVVLKYWASLVACMTRPGFEACLHHYRQATIFAIRLGILDKMVGESW